MDDSRRGIAGTPAADVLRRLLPWVAAGLAVVAVELLVHATTDTSYQQLVVDASELSDEVSSVAGAITTLGVVLWAGAAVVALFAVWLRRDHALAPALTWLAVLSTVMAIDDRLRIHEDLSDALGTSEAVVLAVYAALAGWIAWRFATDVRPEWPFAIAAGVGLGTSLVVDQVLEVVLGTEATGIVFVEENSKLLGIVLWFAFVVHVARRAVDDRA